MVTDRRYTGQRWEAGIGLYDYNARYYDPALGRFVQADTLVPSMAHSQDLNRYSYVRGNPLKYNDPSGHGPKEHLVDGGNSTYDYMVWHLRRAWATQAWHEYYTYEEFSTAYWNGLAAAGGDAYDNMTISEVMAFQLTGTSKRTWHWAGVKANASIMLDPDRWKVACASADVQRVMQFELGAQSISPGILSNGPNWTYPGEEYKLNTSITADEIIDNPSILEGKSFDQVRNLLRDTTGWEEGMLNKGRHQEQGWTLHELNVRGDNYTDRYIQYHPGGGRHFDGLPYWKVSSGPNGTQRFPAGVDQ